jgi:DoxX-like family
MRRAQTVEPHAEMQASPAARTSRWPERVGWVLSGLVFFLIDAMGKLLQVPQVLAGSQDLGYPLDTVVPIGLLLLVGAVLYALPRSAVLGAIYLTAFLGGAVAAHARIGSPLFTHILFGVYVAVLMWAGLVLRRPALLGILLGRR